MESHRKSEKRHELTAEPISAEHLLLQWMSQPISIPTDHSLHLLTYDKGSKRYELTAEPISAEHLLLQWMSQPISIPTDHSPHPSSHLSMM